jgi:Zn-finger nucleic acid-binding protein
MDRDRGVFVCDYCLGETVPPAQADGVQVLGGTKFQCPACATSLSDARIETRDLLYCTACHGLLIAMDDFVPLFETLRAYRDRPAAALPRREEAERPPRICPHCYRNMDHHPYGGPGNVFIDTCSRCEINWLDAGELQRIVAAPDPSPYSPVYSRHGLTGDVDD